MIDRVSRSRPENGVDEKTVQTPPDNLDRALLQILRESCMGLTAPEILVKLRDDFGLGTVTRLELSEALHRFERAGRVRKTPPRPYGVVR